MCVEKMGYGMTLPSAHLSVLEFVIFPRRNLTVDFTISFIMGLYHYIIWLIYSSGRKLGKFSHSLISSLFFQDFLLVSFLFSKSILPGAIVIAPITHTLNLQVFLAYPFFEPKYLSTFFNPSFYLSHFLLS